MLPLVVAGSPALASSDESQLHEARKLISAFYQASNDNNWAFVNEMISDSANGKTNHFDWLPWAKASKEAAISELAERGPRGFIWGKKPLYDFFRSRQYEQGWAWSQPLGDNSVWQPDYATFASYVRWERTDGGSYFNGPIDHRPRIIHFFRIDKEEDYGTVVSRKISWIEEVDLGNIVYG